MRNYIIIFDQDIHIKFIEGLGIINKLNEFKYMSYAKKYAKVQDVINILRSIKQ